LEIFHHTGQIAAEQEFGKMELAHQRRQYMGSLEIEVVSGPEEVGRHHGEEVCAILFVVVPAKFYRADFGYRIRFVRGFEQAGEQVLFSQRLRRQSRVYT